jgi:hypothetical protein
MGLRTPTGLQAKQRPAIPYQVKLHVTPAAVQLELTLANAVVGVFAAFDNRQIGIGKAFTHCAHKAERGIKIRRVEIVKEQPADAALLVAMLQIEIMSHHFLYFG